MSTNMNDEYGFCYPITTDDDGVATSYGYCNYLGLYPTISVNINIETIKTISTDKNRTTVELADGKTITFEK